jgi:hypothetical protein
MALMRFKVFLLISFGRQSGLAVYAQNETTLRPDAERRDNPI